MGVWLLTRHYDRRFTEGRQSPVRCMARLAAAVRLVAVIRKGRLLAVGHPDELRAHTGTPHIEVTGSGFNESVLNLLRARPEVSAVEVQDKRLSIQLRQDMDVAPLVGLMVGAGVQVEEVRKGKASLEEVFLTLMEEER